jgi:outer membrane immunogenic protein
MKKILLSAVSVLALGVTSSFAADLPARTYTKAPAPVISPAYDWSGFYIGAMGGYGWSNEVSASVAGVGGATIATDSLDGGFGGGTIGYNWQAAPNWVFGLEVDVAGGSIGTSGSVGLITARDRINALGSVTGRLGYTWGPGMLYFKGGYAWANNEVSVDVAGLNVFSESKVHSGWTVGGGLEYMFAPAWSAKVEYMYADFSKENYGASLLAPGIDVGASFHTIKAGINYHFNWGAPLVAKY